MCWCTPVCFELAYRRVRTVPLEFFFPVNEKVTAIPEAPHSPTVRHVGRDVAHLNPDRRCRHIPLVQVLLHPLFLTTATALFCTTQSEASWLVLLLAMHLGFEPSSSPRKTHRGRAVRVRSSSRGGQERAAIGQVGRKVTGQMTQTRCGERAAAVVASTLPGLAPLIYYL